MDTFIFSSKFMNNKHVKKDPVKRTSVKVGLKVILRKACLVYGEKVV